MRRILIRSVVALALLSGATLAFAFSSGPPASRTGAFPVGGKPQEVNCTTCHLGAPVNSGPGAVEILGVPADYQRGQTYPLRVRLSIQHVPGDDAAWGFQIQAVDSTTGDSAGTFVYTSELKVVRQIAGIFQNRRYLEHTSLALHSGELGPVEWSFLWTAPTEDNSVKVYFFVAGNAANGDGCAACSGDFIFTSAESSAALPNPTPTTRRSWGALKSSYRK